VARAIWLTVVVFYKIRVPLALGRRFKPPDANLSWLEG